MGKEKEVKTNVMRVLESKKIEYKGYTYDPEVAIAGDEVARVLIEDPRRVFKTLVTVSGKGIYYVFMVPVNKELNLKAAAKAVGEKSIEMIKSKELLPLTGYIHGGCSPIGMKKLFTTTIDSSAAEFDKIFFSGGKVGFQVEVKFEDLLKIIPVKTADISE